MCRCMHTVFEELFLTHHYFQSVKPVWLPKIRKIKKTLSYVKFIQSYFGNLVDIICEVLMATTNWI